MTHDAFGLSITGAAASSAACYDRYAASWISYGTDLPAVIAASDADPQCGFLAAHAASVHMALEATAGLASAAPYLKRAQDGAAAASPRERAFIQSVLSFAVNDMPATLGALEEAVALAPSDIVAAKWGQYHAFNLGDAARMRAFADAILPAHRGTPEAYGMLAFALEQSHDLKGAEDAAWRALSLKRAEPWAHHALAHVMETQGRLQEGLGFLKAQADTWEDRSIFIRGHNWWHVVLFLLDLDSPKEALAIFDQRLWGVWPEFAQEQIGAISALWRMELRGVDVGERWRPVAAKVAERGHEHLQPFHDLHFLYALARAGAPGEAEAFLASMTAAALGKRPCVRLAWADVAVPAARGLLAYGQGRYGEAAELLGRALPALQIIGGSHAQRDLFAQTWIDALWRAGDAGAAAKVLSDRLDRRGEAIGLRRLYGLVCGTPAIAAG
ncbi:MAG: tetratricopeptide repeat protein [Alphaproteobacteria bacterium]|nr:tetratricopeptide repeat protein [Alphaproteobacteria bacterium]